jgi:hypothetical protein
MVIFSSAALAWLANRVSEPASNAIAIFRIVASQPSNFTPVIARSEATKQSTLSLCGKMDCFASLAVTAL